MKRTIATLALVVGLAAALATAFAPPAHANPQLHGTWSAASVDGQPLVVTFNPDGTGKLNGQPIRWQTLGFMLAIEGEGGQGGAYSFQVEGGKLMVSGGDLAGTATLTRGTKAADAARAKQPKVAKAGRAPGGGASNGQELVGKWCDVQSMSNSQGGSSRMECFTLNADGTYTYAFESSRSVAAGSTASQSSDAGRWTYNGRQLTAQSNSGKVASYTLEKRNHPKNRRDPMICLDGACYVTYYNKPAW